MNIANVITRFGLLTGLQNDEIYKWKALIDDACDYVGSIVIKENPDESEARRIEMLCAVYALKLYSLCNDENITSFTAGDVQITSPETGKTGEKSCGESTRKNARILLIPRAFCSAG